MKRFSTKQQGFTLIEIIVVVVIIGILATVVAPRFMGQTDKARIVKAKSDIQALESALDLYKLDNFNYPSTELGLEALVNQPSEDDAPNWQKGGYLKKLQKDPWNNDYDYSYDEGQMKISSLGADGVEGGQEASADISNLD